MKETFKKMQTTEVEEGPTTEVAKDIYWVGGKLCDAHKGTIKDPRGRHKPFKEVR